MIGTAFKQFVKKDFFRLIFVVLLGLFITENGFARRYWNEDFVRVTWIVQENLIVFAIGVYDYSFGLNSEHGYLEDCKFEASVNNKRYFKLMEIQTRWQMKSRITRTLFKNKSVKALIMFTNDYTSPTVGIPWYEDLSTHMQIRLPICEDTSADGLIWKLDQIYKNVRYIRISGKWTVAGLFSEHFKEVVYDLNLHYQNALNSNTLDTITIEPEIDPVTILKNSEAIVIKGAASHANIKVYSKSGLEIKSVISDNDVVKIKLPVNQIYIVHVGKSRYKVAL